MLFIHAQYSSFFHGNSCFHSPSLSPVCVNWNQFSLSFPGAKASESIWHSNDMFPSNTSSVCFIYSFLHVCMCMCETRHKTWNRFWYLLLLLWFCFIRGNANVSRQALELLHTAFEWGIYCKNVQRSATMTSTQWSDKLIETEVQNPKHGKEKQRMTCLCVSCECTKCSTEISHTGKKIKQ